MPVNEKIMGALAGLAGAVSNEGKTAATDSIVSLCLLSAAMPLSPAEEQELTELIDSEKYPLSPGCKSCASPCGNTSAYSSEEFFAEAEEIKTLKYETAAAACEYIKSLSDEERSKLPDCVYSVLVSWKYRFAPDEYRQLCAEIKGLI